MVCYLYKIIIKKINHLSKNKIFKINEFLSKTSIRKFFVPYYIYISFNWLFLKNKFKHFIIIMK